jgi:hypothetical protein
MGIDDCRVLGTSPTIAICLSFTYFAILTILTYDKSQYVVLFNRLSVSGMKVRRS